jgi:hypothetical protein
MSVFWGHRPFIQMILLEVFLFGWVFVCYCAVPKYIGVIIIFVMYALSTVGSSPCLCSSVVYRSVFGIVW